MNRSRKIHKSFRLTHFSGANGLSQNTVNCILEDHRGLKWFGTQNGLNRYDGHAFSIYRHIEDCDTSLSSYNITALYEDTQNNLWVATARGLNRFDYATETFERFILSSEPETGISSNYINTICQDNDDESLLWLGTAYGLTSFNILTKTLQPNLIQCTNTMACNNIRALCDDGLGSLWCGTDGDGLYQFHKEERNFVPADCSDKNLRVTAAFRATATELLIGTDKQGLYSFDMTHQTLTPFAHEATYKAVEKSFISCIGQDLSGRLWIGTTDIGVRVYSRYSQAVMSLQHDRFDPESMPSNWVRSLSFDSGERIWIGTLTGGVSLYDPHKYKFEHIKSLPSRSGSLLSNVVRCFQEDSNGSLWVGAEGGGVDRYDELTGDFIHYVHDPADDETINSNMVRGMYLDKRQRLWVFTWNGLCYFNAEQDKFLRYALPTESGLSIQAQDLRFYYESNDGAVWIGSEHGLVCHDPAANSYELYNTDPLNLRRIMGDRQRFIFEHRDGVIRVSTISGHSAIDRSKHTVLNYGLNTPGVIPLSKYFVLSF